MIFIDCILVDVEGIIYSSAWVAVRFCVPNKCLLILLRLLFAYLLDIIINTTNISFC